MPHRKHRQMRKCYLMGGNGRHLCVSLLDSMFHLMMSSLSARSCSFTSRVCFCVFRDVPLQESPHWHGSGLHAWIKIDRRLDVCPLLVHRLADCVRRNVLSGRSNFETLLQNIFSFADSSVVKKLMPRNTATYAGLPVHRQGRLCLVCCRSRKIQMILPSSSYLCTFRKR